MPKLAKYDKVEAIIRNESHNDGELTVDEAKELLGWQDEESSGKKFGEKFLFKDVLGNKVRLENNKTNRPFRKGIAHRYALEHLRRKWQLNGETLIFDRLGNAASAQHRLVSLVFASQMAGLNPDEWKPYLKGQPVTMPCILVFGVSDKDEVADTNDLGQKRTLGDVIFRNREFKGSDEAGQKAMSSILSHALRLAWLRVGGKTVSNAPHFPHSEALDFQDNHPKLLAAVEFIVGLDKDDEVKRIGKYITLGYASALFYLAATSKTDLEEFGKKGTKSINDSLWPKAEKFWTIFASGASKGAGDLFHYLRNKLDGISASGGAGRDEICATVVKAWEIFLEHGADSEVKPTQLNIKKKKTGKGKMALAEDPRFGGLDTVIELAEEKEEVEEVEEVQDEQAEAA